MKSNLAIKLTPEEEECYRVIESFEYFLDEHVWIEEKADNQPIKLNLWPDQRRVLPDFLDAQFIEILKAHQLGYTWIFVAAYALWLSITKPMHQVVINSFNEDVGREIIRRVNFIRVRLDNELLIPKVGIDTTLMIEFLHKDDRDLEAPSTIQVIPATEKGGQSKTPNVMIFDESCFNRYVAQAYNGSLPGIMQARGKIIIISNAIKTAPGWAFTRGIYTGSMKGLNNFERIFLPWWANPNRSKRIIQGEVDGRGQPMTEFKKLMLASGGKDGGRMDEEDFSQRYPETEAEAISVIGGSYFGKVLGRHEEYLMDGSIGELKKDQHKDIVFNNEQRGNLEVWRFPYYLIDKWDGLWWTDRYVIGSDISEGLGESYSVAYVMDRHLNELVARVRSRWIDAHKWGTLLYYLSLFYDKAMVVPERTGAGITSVKRLMNLNANLYTRLIPGKAGNPTTKEVGWSETHKTKHELCGDLKTWLGSVKTPAIYCNLLIDECSTYIQDDIGRLDPEEGKYGDCVIAAGCTVQGDLFIGKKPEVIDPGPTGWLKEWQEANQEQSNWAR